MVIQYRKAAQQWRHNRQIGEMTSQPDAGFFELYHKKDWCMSETEAVLQNTAYRNKEADHASRMGYHGII